MKKQLLIGSALLAAVSSFSQHKLQKPATGVGISAVTIAERLSPENGSSSSNISATQAVNSSETTDETPKASRTASFVSNWNAISSSINPYGVVESGTRPLQYNEDLNAVTFIHRKSPTYVASPAPAATAESGVIMALISQDWGNTWDSTCLWNDNVNWGRYPQGAILAAPGSTNMYSGQLVGVTAITSQSNGWIGNGFYTKQMGQVNYTNVAPTTNTFFPTLNPTLGKTDFTSYDFQATDDGKVVTLGYVDNDPNSATNIKYRGARVVKGTFVSGNMIWTSDSLIPNVLSTSAGDKILAARPRMAWSEDGQVGYVIQIGADANATLNNRGYQPIVHRTGNGGNSWSQVSGIDFNSPTMTLVTNWLLSPNSNSNVTIPYFNISEGIGMTVDKDNKLHIACTLFATSSPDPDSLNYIFSFNNADGEKYRYRHSPGFRPYVYDFTGDGLPNSPWRVTLIDSLSSERPGTNAASSPDGFTTNPWSVDADGNKVEVQDRIQCSRTPDGKYIVYTWAESDTLFTTNSFKWNELPNIKARLMDVSTGLINPLEINVTKPGNYPFITNNTNVSSRAYLHCASPKCALAQTMAVSPAGPAIILPLTTTRPNGVPLSQTIPSVHRYTSALLNFGNVSQGDINLPKAAISVGIAENALSSANASFIYPNPAKGAANLAIDLKDNSKVEVSVVNMIGQIVKTTTTDSQIGQSTVNIDLNGLSQGVYMVNVKVANSTSTKKLIVE